MWVASKYGWFSIVQKKPGEFHVRARRKEDLRNLAAAIAPAIMIEPRWVRERFIHASYAGSDYPWRMIVNDSLLRVIMGVLAASVDYGNFKAMIHNSPTQAHKSAGYGRMWATAKEWEKEGA